jgi:hypothetical protein
MEAPDEKKGHPGRGAGMPQRGRKNESGNSPGGGLRREYRIGRMVSLHERHVRKKANVKPRE